MQQERTTKLHIVLLTAFIKTLAVILVILFSVIIFLFGAMGLVIHGPSPLAKEMLVTTFMETSFMKLFPPLYLSDEEINNIIAKNALVEMQEVTDTGKADFTNTSDKPENVDRPDIEVLDISGATYKGKVMLVKDPSRLKLGTAPVFGEDESGEKIEDMISKLDGVAGINAGGFADRNGGGKGGMALGIVIKDSKVMCGDGTYGVVIGFDDKDVLIVGNMSVNKAKELKIRDAVSFGPALVVNGKPAQISGSGGGLNPRTAIGQREDGTVILMIVDGRQPHSLGATYKDMVDEMVKQKAVNAGNLDGGSSTMMYYNGEMINQCASISGPRKVPTCFVVK